MVENVYIECVCHSPEHTIHLMRVENPYDSNPDDEFYMGVYLENGHWYERVWKALKYIFGHRCIYGQFDEFIIDREGADKMIKFLSQKPLTNQESSDTIDK
jgi:hypothetical protein